MELVTLSRQEHSSSLGHPHLQISGFGAGQESGSLMSHSDTNPGSDPLVLWETSSNKISVQRLNPTHVGTEIQQPRGKNNLAKHQAKAIGTQCCAKKRRSTLKSQPWHSSQSSLVRPGSTFRILPGHSSPVAQTQRKLTSVC